MRYRRTKEEAEKALKQILHEYADRLGINYRVPRRYAWKDRPQRVRRGMSPRLRFRILSRDGFTCHYCGARPPDAVLHIDHVVPIAAGGTDDEGNLVAACAECNLGKADVPVEARP